MRLALIALLLVACGEDPAPSQVFTIELVTPTGDNPLLGADMVRLRVQQGETEPVDHEVAVTDGALSADIALADLITPVRIGVEVMGPEGARIGAPPPFVPVEAAVSFLVRIPVGAPDGCARVAGMDLDAARAGIGLALHSTFVLAVGGVAAGGPSPAAGFLDLLELDTGDFDALPYAAGPARAVPYNVAQAIVVSDTAAPFRYDISSADMPVLEGGLHAGAGMTSALVALGARGAVVLGGADASGPVAGVSWVAADGTTSQSTLAAPREGAAAVALGDTVLVLGGATVPWAELVPVGGDGRALDVMADDRDGGVLVAAGDGTRALLLGGVDSSGSPVESTILFTCDAAACTTTAGPTFSRARTGFALAPLPSGGALLAGGEGPAASVDRVRFDGDGAHIEPIGDLETAREDASAFAIEAGLVYIVGGTGPAGPLADSELCFPSFLAAP